jgi:hypothetical protein
MLADKKRTVGVFNIAPRTGSIAILLTFDEPQTAKELFLRSIFREPSFGRKTSGGNIELPRGKQCAHIGSGLSATNYLAEDQGQYQ